MRHRQTTRVIDHRADGGALLGPALGGQAGVALRHVKQAAVVSPRPRKSAMAWPEADLFPCHTPQDALLSAAYAELQREHVPQSVRAKIAAACRDFCVDLTGLVGALAETRTKQASNDETDVFALETERRWRMNTPAEVKLAAVAFTKHGGVLSFTERGMAARRIVKRAAALGLSEGELPEAVEAYAGLKACATEKLASSLVERACRTNAGHVAQELRKLAYDVRMRPVIHDPLELASLVEVVATADRVGGLDHYYESGSLPDPVATVFNHTKTAEGDTIMLGHAPASWSKLYSIPVGTWTDILGDDVRSEIEDAPGSDATDPGSLRAVVETLPLDMKRAIASTLPQVML